MVDGRRSDGETQSLLVADASGIKLVASTDRIGIGLLQEGKTMGLAPFGEGVEPYVFQFERNFEGIVTDYSKSGIDGSYKMGIQHRALLTFEDKARAAYDIQRECEAAMDHLCISGGVALNSVANYKILQTGLFKDVFVNPAASDTGIPLGVALYGLHNVFGIKRDYDSISPFTGPTYTTEEVNKAIDSFGGYRVERDGAVALAAEMLASNNIVACHYGRSEMGPRALGNRSIFMSPLKAENKEILNSRVKHREAFRPFAPVILEDRVSEYFMIDRPCPYMLFVPQVRKDKQSVIPAVTHVDGSGRLQTVTAELNPLFYSLIEKFDAITGVPVMLNTSFNDNNEPVVETPEDAIRCFMGTNIDALLIGGDILLVKDQA